MKLACKDCGFGIIVDDESRKHCPQCGSMNIHLSVDNEIVKAETEPKIPRTGKRDKIQSSKKKSKIKKYFIISFVLSCIAGVISIIIFLNALIVCDPDGCFISTGVLKDWWVIPLGFLLGFIALPIGAVFFVVISFFHDYT